MQVCFIFRKILRLKNSGSFGRCVCNHFLKWTYYTLTSNIFIYVLPITSITSSTTNCITVSVHDIYLSITYLDICHLYIFPLFHITHNFNLLGKKYYLILVESVFLSQRRYTFFMCPPTL